MLFVLCGCCVGVDLSCYFPVGVLFLLCFFFFQAEDGIRDLVRSRGLGDVYKRQALDEGRRGRGRRRTAAAGVAAAAAGVGRRGAGLRALSTVSYTHLTLPTSDLV